MLQKLKKRTMENSKGFTIIEVLIVLAIAGLILLIVFLAVPALQRNSRNTQRRNDVSAALGAIQEATNNNSGQLPADVKTGVSGAKLGFYADDDFGGDLKLTAAKDKAIADINKVQIFNFAKCPATAPTGMEVALNSGSPSKRSVVAVYAVETRTDTQAQCVDM